MASGFIVCMTYHLPLLRVNMHSMDCAILYSPCSAGLGWPQLPVEAQPPSDDPCCWLVVVLSNHSVW